MSDYKIEFAVDGVKVSQQVIAKLKSQRYTLFFLNIR